jgi:hypothetical protein
MGNHKIDQVRSLPSESNFDIIFSEKLEKRAIVVLQKRADAPVGPEDRTPGHADNDRWMRPCILTTMEKRLMTQIADVRSNRKMPDKAAFIKTSSREDCSLGLQSIAGQMSHWVFG